MRWYVPIACLALLVPVSLVRAEEPSNDARSADWAGQLDRLLAARFAVTEPGCAVGVATDSELAYQRGWGLANLEHQIPIGPTTVFNVGSVSKQLTAFVIYTLARDGKIGLDEEVRHYVPELPVYDAIRPITIRHLIHHTSGLRDVNALLGYSGMREGPGERQTGKDWVSPRQTLDMIVRQRGLTSPPGERFTYSNTGYVLLATIAERAAGLPFPRLAEALIFDPLGMDRTSVVDDLDAPMPERAQGYLRRDDGRFVINEPWYPKTGSTGVYTTLHDLVVWQRHLIGAMASGGDAAIGPMLSPGRRSDGRALPYGGGLFLRRWRDRALVEHGGSTFGFATYVLTIPESRFSVMLMCNIDVDDKRDLALAIAGAVLGDQPAQEADHPPAQAGKRPAPISTPGLCGVYRLPGSPRSLAVLETTEGLVARLSTSFGDTRSYPLVTVAESSLEIVGSPISATLDIRRGSPANRPELTLVPGDDRPAIPLEWLEPLTVEQLGTLVGDYYSADLDVTYRIRSDGVALHQEVLRHGGYPLAPGALARVGPRTFLLGDGYTHLQFQPSADGPSPGFVLITRRDIRLDFTRATSSDRACGER